MCPKMLKLICTYSKICKHKCASCSSTYTVLSQRRLQWLGYVHRMADGPYGEHWDTHYRTHTYPLQKHRKHDVKMAGISDRGKWRSVVNTCMGRGDDRRRTQQAEIGDHWKQRSANVAVSSQPTVYVYRRWGRDCHARDGHLRPARRCTSQN